MRCISKSTAQYVAMVLLSFLCLIIHSCNRSGQAQAYEDDSEDMTQYLAQDHRFEVRDCLLFYNEQQVVLDSVNSFERKFDTTYHEISDFHWFYVDKPVQVFLDICKESDGKYRYCLKRMSVLLTHQEKYNLNHQMDSIRSVMPTLEGYVLFNGVLVNADTKVDELNAKLQAKGKPTLKPQLGNKADQGLVYDPSYCASSPICQDGCLTHVGFYYHNERGTKEYGKIQTLRYELAWYY